MDKKICLAAALAVCLQGFPAGGLTEDPPAPASGDVRPDAPAKSSKIKKPIKKIGEMAKPVEKAVTKTAETAVKEATAVAKEAHSLGGKFLQSLINIMIAASPGKTRVYLPAPSSDPNSGVTVGVLPVFLFVDDKETIRHILAPSVTYNSLFKVNSTMRYYWYPRKGAQLFTIGSYAWETNRRFTLRYEDPGVWDGRLYFKSDYTLLREGSYRFYGFGPNSRAERQSNYTLRDNHFQIFTGVNFLEKFRFTAAHRFRWADAVDGPIDSLPDISAFSPAPPRGVDEPLSVMAQRVILSYDSRDLPVAPVRGHYFTVFGESAGRLGGDPRFERYGADLRGFYPLSGNRFVTGWRFLAEDMETKDDVPFYEQSWLGGKDSLRGFGEGRFVDKNKISFTIEERIRFYTLKAFNVNIDFEVTPFYETGTVIPRFGLLTPDDLHHVGGVGFRSVVRPNVVGIIDLGFGQEGTTIYVGIDYPF